jgi:hypothetical protein
MDLENFKNILKEKLSISRYNLRGYCNSKEVKKLLKDFTDFLDEDSKNTQRAWHLINNINYIPLCKNCNKNKTSFNNNKFGYLDYCSVKCQRNSDQVKENIKSTLKLKYGEEIINPYQIKEVKDKIKKTMIEKYGVEHNSNFNHNKERTKEFFKSEEFKNKSKSSMNKKYGVDHYSKTEEFKNKLKETCIEKYGVEHHMQNSEIFEKQQKNSKKYKKYTLPSGKIVLIQGYEDKALDFLFSNGINELDIFIERKDIEKEIGILIYNHKGKNKRYYPDFYIKSLNKIIEVKSTWTLDKNGKLSNEDNINYSKMISCKNQGFNFEFLVM